VLFQSALDAQIRVIAAEKLPVAKGEHWSNAVFSPTGEDIYMTNSDYNGIWQYSLVKKILKEITLDKYSGYNFVLSDDGSTIAYRRTAVEGDHRTRIQETVEMKIKTMEQIVIEKGNSIATPVFIHDRISQTQKVFRSNSTPMLDQTVTQVVGIEETKIVLIVNGVKTVADPLQNGQYIWPVLSPDKRRLAVVEMERGAFVSDLDGKNIVMLGKCNAPKWTRDGKWIIGMDDKDDGRSIYSSEIIAVSSDGSQRIALTETPSRIEMFPAISPAGNKIVVTTLDGEVFVLTVEEGE
jgi:Tol biopolymer transport system component